MGRVHSGRVEYRFSTRTRTRAGRVVTFYTQPATRPAAGQNPRGLPGPSGGLGLQAGRVGFSKNFKNPRFILFLVYLAGFHEFF